MRKAPRNDRDEAAAAILSLVSLLFILIQSRGLSPQAPPQKNLLALRKVRKGLRTLCSDDFTRFRLTQGRLVAYKEPIKWILVHAW